MLLIRKILNNLDIVLSWMGVFLFFLSIIFSLGTSLDNAFLRIMFLFASIGCLCAGLVLIYFHDKIEIDIG